MTTKREYQPFETRPILLPAIDLREGRVVRLVRGAGDAEIGYEQEPLTAARQWIDEGGECLHIIDLGSALGEADSSADILHMASKVKVPIQVGGGLREGDRIRRLLEGGVSRVILGTRAFRDPEFLRSLVEKYGADRIVLAMDIAEGRVRISGWTEDSSIDMEGGIHFAVGSGIEHLLVTAIDRDGMLSGPNLPLIGEALERAEKQQLSVVAAGGIGDVGHIQSILDLRRPALEGVVIGRALYEGTVSLREALEMAGEYR